MLTQENLERLLYGCRLETGGFSFVPAAVS
jgi:hypothetical protein